MIKVLYLGMSGNLGGIETFIFNFWRSFDKNKIQIDFIKTDESICFESELLAGGSKIFKIPSRRKNFLKHIYFLFTFLLNHKEYKIVHIHLNTCSSIELAIVAKLCKRIVIVHSHNEWKGKSIRSKLLHLINKPIMNIIVDKRLACSHKAGKWLFGNKDYTIINNAIDAKEYIFDEEKRKEVRSQFKIDNRFVIGNIGRFSYQKNHKFLIDVFRAIYKKNNSSVLLLVGDGEERVRIEEKIKAYGLTESVILTGVRYDVPDLLQAMDVFVLPSLFEGLGIVAIEAQSAGLPCIIADSIPNEVTVTKDCVRIPLNDKIDRWTEEILKFSNNFKRKNRYKEISKKGYDIYTAAKILEDIYLILSK